MQASLQKFLDLRDRPGFFETNGLAIPDWLAWGLVPTAVVLIAHYYSLAYTIIAAALIRSAPISSKRARWPAPGVHAFSSVSSCPSSRRR